MIELAQETKSKMTPIVSIKVIGIGGAGGNTVNSIVESGNDSVHCIVANTDAQALNLSKAEEKIQLGVKSTKGLGTGSNPDLGKRAAEEDIDKVMEVIAGADIVFLAAGMGGGTGSGGISVIARALKDRDILTIAIVTKPFLFEGKRRAAVADEAIALLKKEVDTLIVLPNQKLLETVDQNVSMIDAFAMINNILSQAVKGISDIITRPGHINVDFSDVRAIMKGMGLAIMGTGVATGPDRAQEAAMQAISSPLFENMNITGAHGVLLNITGGKNLSLHEISQAASIIYNEADENANIILGSVIDESMSDEVMVTIIATGFDEYNKSDDHAISDDMQVKATVLDKEAVALNAEMQSDQKIRVQELDGADVQKEQDELKEHKEEQAVEAASDVKKEKELVCKRELVDMENLDVPAFLRKEIAEKSKEN